MRCSVWPEAYGQSRGEHETTWVVNGDRTGGSYRIDRAARDACRGYASGADREILARLTTWIVNERELGVMPHVTIDRFYEANAAKPLRVSERLTRFYKLLAKIGYRPGEVIRDRFLASIDPNKAWFEQLAAWTESTSTDDLGALLSLLEENGEIAFDSSSNIKLTARGLARMEEIDTSPVVSRQAFVAMWFSPEMYAVYNDAIAPAVEECGFTPRIISNVEHNRKIDDEIIAEIRRSLFVIADFTCPLVTSGEAQIANSRGGVYFEAGFARGLNREVIWTVRSDCLPYLHFDTRTFNHIEWENAGDLKARLIARINATIVT